MIKKLLKLSIYTIFIISSYYATAIEPQSLANTTQSAKFTPKGVEEVFTCNECCPSNLKKACDTFYNLCVTNSLNDSVFIMIHRNFNDSELFARAQDYLTQTGKTNIIFITTNNDVYFFNTEYNDFKEEIDNNIDIIAKEVSKKNNAVYRTVEMNRYNRKFYTFGYSMGNIFADLYGPSKATDDAKAAAKKAVNKKLIIKNEAYDFTLYKIGSRNIYNIYNIYYMFPYCFGGYVDCLVTHNQELKLHNKDHKQSCIKKLKELNIPTLKSTLTTNSNIATKMNMTTLKSILTTNSNIAIKTNITTLKDILTTQGGIASTLPLTENIAPNDNLAINTYKNTAASKYFIAFSVCSGFSIALIGVSAYCWYKKAKSYNKKINIKAKYYEKDEIKTEKNMEDDIHKTPYKFSYEHEDFFINNQVNQKF